MHGSTGGRWRSCVHGATEPTHPAGKPAGLSPSDLPTADQPAAYLTFRRVMDSRGRLTMAMRSAKNLVQEVEHRSPGSLVGEMVVHDPGAVGQPWCRVGEAVL